jgi:hypothetical protein
LKIEFALDTGPERISWELQGNYQKSQLEGVNPIRPEKPSRHCAAMLSASVVFDAPAQSPRPRCKKNPHLQRRLKPEGRPKTIFPEVHQVMMGMML